ncbi:MAG: GspH/FimT family pseudopilin [Gammaproteobacteria bacterium]|nr:GspH/FimT family pseudopilin [Gammaproteobacteria bacterium]
MQRGFSLVELVVAMALLAIATSLAVPSYRNTVVQNRLAAVTNNLIGAVELTRSEAVRRRITMDLMPNATWTQGWVVRRNGSADPNENVLSYTSPAGVSLSLTYSISSPPENLSFNSRGLRTPISNVLFTICDDATHKGRTVALSPTGAVTITTIANGCAT